MNELIAYRGKKFVIEYGICTNGSAPAKEFFDSLSERDQAKLMALFVRMGEEGVIRNEEKFKRVEGTECFAFKSFQIRMICRFQPGGRLILLCGLWKKKDRYPPTEIERAKRIFEEHQGRQSG